MSRLSYIPLSEIQRIKDAVSEPRAQSQLLADMFRINTLYMIARAGSGHIGTSFSCLDIITWLWTQAMRNSNEIYFSSKGHDAPALYSLLIGLGKIDFEYIHKLRRLHGLPGHPDVATPYMMTNTGPLGMGISKARGLAWANRLAGKKGHFYVLTGDGELQEGQIWESLQPTANGRFSEITVIVDHNKLQSDTLVSQVSDLGDLEKKFASFGWAVFRCAGHDFNSIQAALEKCRAVTDKPQVIIADTVKGKGVSFMEQPPADGLYQFHAGAPSRDQYEAALAELTRRVNDQLNKAALPALVLETIDLEPKPASGHPERLVPAYGEALVSLARERVDIIALDADLVKDTGLVPFKKEFPERYIECGIAEQDMVSLAGGLALQGKLPIVHSFACFLSTRPNEQIYNNATEKTKIIYIGALAGLLPAGPGHSHQSVRDISTLGSIPGLTLIQPSCEREVQLVLRWAVADNTASTYIRLTNVPVEIPFSLPAEYKLEPGCGVKLHDGAEVALIAYGPVMLSEAVKAAQELAKENISAAVYNLPWLNRVSADWIAGELGQYRLLVAIDDHYTKFGQGSLLASAVAQTGSKQRILQLGLEQIPECGQNDEVLRYHRLDYQSIAERVKGAKA